MRACSLIQFRLQRNVSASRGHRLLAALSQVWLLRFFFFFFFTLLLWCRDEEKFFSGLWSWQVNKWKVFALLSEGRSNGGGSSGGRVLWFVIPELQEAPAASLVQFVFLSFCRSWKHAGSPVTFDLQSLTQKLSTADPSTITQNSEISRSFLEDSLILYCFHFLIGSDRPTSEPIKKERGSWLLSR